MSSFLERLYTSEQATDGEESQKISHEFSEHFPCLTDFLCCVKVFDKKREPGTLLLFSEEGKLKVMLHDKDRQMTGWLTVHNTACFFQEVEVALADDCVDWRRKRDSRRRV